jgi:hypothetical protein
MRIRSLPLRLQPIEGEAIDSYIEAYAARIGATFTEFEDAVGLERIPNSERRGWLVQLGGNELTSLAAATGLPADCFPRMTLSHFDGRAVRVDSSQRCLTYGVPWGYARASRFCPECLADTGGRWSLTWRLGWSYACLKHSCALAHQCPECGEPQRVRPHIGNLRPRPGRCANVAAGAARRSRSRCGADLTTAATLPLSRDHPAIEAQRALCSIIEGSRPRQGVYRNSSYSTVDILSDVRNLAREVLGNPDGAALAGLVPNDLLAARAKSEERRGPASAASQLMTRHQPDSLQTAPRDALETAIGVTAVWTSLNEPEVRLAAAAIRPVITNEAYSRKPPVPVLFLEDRRITPTLASVYVGALGPHLTATEQLRHRTHTHPIPALPLRARGSVDFDRRIPTLLWESWSLQMPLSKHRSRTIRTVLSVAVALSGSRVSFGEVVERLDTSLKPHTFNRILASFRNCDWEVIATAIERLSEYVDANRPPIDYRRRRALDYADILPPQVWSRICLEHGLSGIEPFVDAARLHLVERLSAQPVVLSTTQANHVTKIVHQGTPAFGWALNRHCREYLSALGVRDEPLTWAPGTNLIVDLDLPRPGPGQVDLNTLHILIRREGCSVAEAAQRLGVSSEVVLFCLEQHPAPKDVRQHPRYRLRHPIRERG